MSENYPDWLKRIAQTGLVAKGVVYFIFGVLILMTTYIPTDEPVGLFELVKYTIDLGWFGRLILALMALGLFCYSAWKFFQMVYNVEGYKDDFMGYFVRITWLGPFVFYIGLGGHALLQLINWYTGRFSYFRGEPNGLQDLLYTNAGKWLVGFIAFTLLVNGVSLFYLAFTGKYTIMLTGRGFFQSSPRLAKITGFTGYTGYGITLSILAVLFGLSIYYTDGSLARGQDSLFYYLMNQPFGRLLLTAISVGTICYGLYFFMASFYRWREPEADSSTNTGK